MYLSCLIHIPLTVRMLLVSFAVFSSFAGSNPLFAQEVQTIDQVVANPDGVDAKQLTIVTVTARIGVTSTLLPDSVTLLLYDSHEKMIKNLGRMYDDGTHGDTRIGDNTFTTTVTFNKHFPQILYFRVSVANRGAVDPTISAPTPFYVRSTISAEKMIANVAADIEAGNIESALKKFTGSPHNRDVLSALNRAQRTEFAASFRRARLIEAEDNVRVYGIPWRNDDGTTTQVRISLSRSILNEWFIMSW